MTSLHSEWLEVQPPKKSIYFVFRSWIHLKDCVRQVVQSYTFIVAVYICFCILFPWKRWESLSGWWFQVSTHLKNMQPSNWESSSLSRGKNTKSLSCHHLGPSFIMSFYIGLNLCLLLFSYSFQLQFCLSYFSLFAFKIQTSHLPWTPKPWNMKVLHPKIWVITSKNEGFGFPWLFVNISRKPCGSMKSYCNLNKFRSQKKSWDTFAKILVQY